jgi:hypothetical protein
MQIMKRKIVPIIGMSILLWLPLSGSGAALGTRQRTITPTLITNVPGIFASDLALYATKFLTPVLREKIANCGDPLGHKLAIDRTETGVVINFLGELQSADTSKNCHNPCTTCRVFMKLIRSTPTAPTVVASMR